MGAWGFKVFENDSACDFMFDIEKPIKKLALKKKLHVFDYEDVRASAEIIIRLCNHYRFDDELAEAIVEKLLIIKSNDNWVDGWDTLQL